MGIYPNPPHAQMTNPMFMELDIQPLNPKTIVLYADHKQAPGDSGLDLFMPDEVVLSAHSFGCKVPLGIKCRAHMQHVTKKAKRWPIGFDVHVRSSTGARTTLRLANGTGIIDETYRGELCLLLDNHGDTAFTIEAGSRLSQIVAPSRCPIKMALVSALDATVRGEGGIGSTGK